LRIGAIARILLITDEVVDGYIIVFRVGHLTSRNSISVLIRIQKFYGNFYHCKTVPLREIVGCLGGCLRSPTAS